jgi:hypothetical protein
LALNVVTVFSPKLTPPVFSKDTVEVV